MPKITFLTLPKITFHEGHSNSLNVSSIFSNGNEMRAPDSGAGSFKTKLS